MINFVFSLLTAILQNRIGQFALVAFCSWVWSSHTTAIKYEKIIAAEKAALDAAYAIEIQREQYAAREIAEAATRRAEDDAEVSKEMSAVINNYEKKLSEIAHVKTDETSCYIDNDFARVVQQLGETSYRHPRAARRAQSIRKNR
jgi:replicative DNA helicase